MNSLTRLTWEELKRKIVWCGRAARTGFSQFSHSSDPGACQSLARTHSHSFGILSFFTRFVSLCGLLVMVEFQLLTLCLAGW